MKPHRRGALTADEYKRLNDNGQYRSEMSRGLLVREPRPGALHAQVAFELAVLLREFVQKRGLGRVDVEAGFRLSTEPLTVRGPDVAFIARDRLPSETPESWWPLAPDLAVEVVSATKSLADLQEKIFEYFEAGTRQVWLIVPRTRSVTVYRSLSDISIIREPDLLDGGDLLPGLALQLDSFLPPHPTRPT